MRRTKPITLDICGAVLQRNDLFGLYISPMAPLFPPEFATASSISGIQIARAMTVIRTYLKIPDCCRSAINEE